MAEPQADDAADALLDGLRADGLDRADPLAFQVIAALARRRARHDGAVGRWLDTRLQARIAALRARPRTAEAPAVDDAPAAARLPAGDADAAELKALRWYGDTWSRLRLERRLDQALATVPGNAGPLNTQRLIHETLAAMQALSPAYLQHFVAHVDALLALDAALSAGPGERPAAERKKGGAGSRRPSPPR